jgi:hypothetical protein
MENITINGNAVSLETLRKGVADAVKRAYGAERNYAIALNAMFASDWFTVEASDTSEAAKPVHAEKKALYVELNAIKHKNPSTVWARIRKYGKEERYGKDDEEGSEAGAEGEGEGEGAGSNDRAPMLRNIEELTSLYKFNARQEQLPEKVAQAQRHIIQALSALGVDINLL